MDRLLDFLGDTTKTTIGGSGRMVDDIAIVTMETYHLLLCVGSGVGSYDLAFGDWDMKSRDQEHVKLYSLHAIIDRQDSLTEDHTKTESAI